MKKILLSFLMCASFALATTHAQIEYSEDFESLNSGSATALSDAGWLIFGNVFDPAGPYLYGYGVFGAPNGNLDGGGFRFSAIQDAAPGANGGAQYIAAFPDYNNGELAIGNSVEANVFQERVLSGADLGLDYTYTFDYDPVEAAVANPAFGSAVAFVKVLDPTNGFATVHFNTFDTSAGGAGWKEGQQLTATIDPTWDGHIIQWGFASTVSNYIPAAVRYDNLSFEVAPPVIPTMGQWALFILGLMITTLGVVTIRRQAIA